MYANFAPSAGTCPCELISQKKYLMAIITVPMLKSHFRHFSADVVGTMFPNTKRRTTVMQHNY